MSEPRILRPMFKKALIVEEPHPDLDAHLRAQGIEPERLSAEAADDPAQVIERLRSGQHDLLYKRSKFEVGPEVLDASSRLAAVMLCCIGDDSVDKRACAERGVLVMNDPVSNGRSVVELVFGEMLTLARRVFEANEASHRHEWTKGSRGRYELQDKTLGVLGLGNIGKQVAQLGAALGMRIVFYDDRELAREVGIALGWTFASSVDELFGASDIVTIHVSAENARGESNRNLLGYNTFSKLGASRPKPGPRLLINAGRGFLFEPADLLRAVGDGHIHYAAVDVFPEEPGSRGAAWTNPYASEPRVVTTPHIGAATQEAQPRIAEYVARTTKMLDCEGAVRSCVFAPGQRITVDAARASHVLAVVHSDRRGTKKAIADAIFEAGLNNIESAHRDFPKHGIAYDISAIDGALGEAELAAMVERARSISGDESAIRSVRQIEVCAER